MFKFILLFPILCFISILSYLWIPETFYEKQKRMEGVL